MKMDEIVDISKKQAKVINDLNDNQKILITRIDALEQTKSVVNTKEVVNEAVDRIVAQVEKKVVPAPAVPAPAPATPAPAPVAAPAPVTPAPAVPATPATPATPAEPAKEQVKL